MSRHLRIAAAVAAVIVSVPFAVRAQTTGESGISVTPAKTEADLPARDFSQQITYSNNKDSDQTVDLVVQELWQQSDNTGTAEGHKSAAISAAFTLSTSSLTIPAKSTRSVTLSGSIPKGKASSYVAVIAKLQSAPGNAVVAKFQILSSFLLRAPKPWVQRVAVTNIGIDPAKSNGERTVYATVKNLGNVHVRPTGSIEVRKNGKLLGSIQLDPLTDPPPAILPTCNGGCSRNLLGTWHPQVAVSGTISLIAKLKHPDALMSRTVKLSSATTAVPSASLGFFKLSTNEVVVRLTNTGKETLSGLSIQLTAREDKQSERGRIDIPQAALDPGAKRFVTWQPGLKIGPAYTITARALLNGQELATAEGHLSASGGGGSSKLLLILAAVLVAIAIGLLIWFMRRKRARKTPEPAVTRTAVH